MEEKAYLRCYKCREQLVDKEVKFSYLGREFSHRMPCCPKCGQVFISERMAKGKMAEVEKLLEGK